jgi:hypothetical protein
MPTVKTNEFILLAQRIQRVDSARPTTDLFKLPSVIREALDERLAEVLSFDSEQQSIGAIRTRSVTRRREALVTLSERLRDGFRFIKGIPRYEITDVDREAALESYGWQGRQLGDLKTDSRILSLARQAIRISGTLTPVNARYPAALVALIQAQLDIIAETEENVGVGGRQQATRSRDEAMKLLQKAISRVRFYYCAMSDDTDTTAELAKVGLQPKRVNHQRKTKGETVVAEEEPAV